MNMKKRSTLCMLSGLCLELAGCEVRREGAQLTFVNGTHYTHISIGGLIFGILLAAFILWWVLAVIRRFMIRNDINFWGCTVANIIDENKDYRTGEISGRSSRNGAVVYPDYKVEYYASGRKYESCLNGSDLIGCDDTVDIKYLKTRPTIIRVARDNRK